MGRIEHERIEHDGVTVTVHPAEPDRPPVVLLPGLFGGGWIWDNVTGALTEWGHTVASIEEPLGRHPEAIDLGKLCASLGRLIDRLGLAAPVLCGNSLGALLALEYAARHADALSGIVLIGAPGMGEQLEAREWGGLKSPSKEIGFTLARRLFHDQRFVNQELVDRCFAEVSEPRVLLRIMRVLRMTRDYDATELIGSVACPTFLLWGACDAVSKADAWREAVPLFPDARFAAVPESGHSPMIERPAAFNTLLRGFLAELPDVPVTTAQPARR